MQEKKALSRSLALCVGLAAQILLIGCSRDNGVNPTGLSRVGVKGSQSLQELSPENRQRITTLMTKTAWAGEFHHQVLQEVCFGANPNGWARTCKRAVASQQMF